MAEGAAGGEWGRALAAVAGGEWAERGVGEGEWWRGKAGGEWWRGAAGVVMVSGGLGFGGLPEIGRASCRERVCQYV